MDLKSLVEHLIEKGEIDGLIRNPFKQFGSERRKRKYLGAELLPEMMKEKNSYSEDDIAFYAVIADDSTRYSPPVKKQRSKTTSMDVELGELDLAAEITGSQIDSLIRLLEKTDGSAASAEAMAMRLIDTVLVQGLLDKKELQRWQAIVDSQVKITGANKKMKNITYMNPAGHRFAAGGLWSDDTYDPLEDIEKALNLLDEKFGGTKRIINRRGVSSKLKKNANIRENLGNLIVDRTAGTLQSKRGNVTPERLNLYLDAEYNAPAIEHYDLKYRTETGEGYFIPDDVMIFIAETPREQSIVDEMGTGEELLLFDVLGYYGVGTPQAQSSPGDKLVVEGQSEKKPAYISGQSYGTGLPVILEPEAIVVITGIG